MHAEAEPVGRPIHRSCSLESVVRVTSPRDVRDVEDDDVIGEPVRVAPATRRTRAVNESFRAAVDRSYTRRHAAAAAAASPGNCRNKKLKFHGNS